MSDYGFVDPAAPIFVAPDPVVPPSQSGAPSVSQPTAHPTDKTNGTAYAAWIVTTIVGLALQFGIELNPLLTAGLTGFAAWLGGYMTKERRKQ